MLGLEEGLTVGGNEGEELVGTVVGFDTVGLKLGSFVGITILRTVTPLASGTVIEQSSKSLHCPNSEPFELCKK